MIDLAHATWPEIEAALTHHPYANLYIGAVGQHGPHLPLTVDTDLATGVARALAQATGAILLFAFLHGEAGSAEAFTGTISTSPETLRALITDIGRGPTRMGVPALVALNGHIGSRDPIVPAARTLLSAGLPSLNLDYPGLEPLAARICDSQHAGRGFFHADEVEASMLLALHLDVVQTGKAAPEYPVFPETLGHHLIRFRKISASSIFGDPRPATATKGQTLIDRIVANSIPPYHCLPRPPRAATHPT